MIKLLLISDLHLTEDGTLYGWNAWERLRLCMDHMTRFHGDAFCTVLLGDLAHEGREDVYERLSREMASMKMPVLAVPGNHDDAGIMEACFRQDGAGNRRPGISLTPYVSLPEAQMLFFSTARPGEDAGSVSEQDASRLRQALSDARAGRKSRTILLFMHHPPLRSGIPAMDAIGLTGTASLREAAGIIRADQGLRMMIICGHLHRFAAGIWCGLPVVTLRGLMPEVCLAQPEGTKGLAGRDTPPSYGVLMLEDGESSPCMAVHEEFFLERGRMLIL